MKRVSNQKKILVGIVVVGLSAISWSAVVAKRNSERKKIEVSPEAIQTLKEKPESSGLDAKNEEVGSKKQPVPSVEVINPSTKTPIESASTQDENQIATKKSNVNDGRWSGTFFSFANMKAQQLDDKNPSVFAYSFLGLNRKLDEDSKLSLRVPFTLNTQGTDAEGKNVENKWALANVHLVYSLNRVVSTQEWEVSGNGRVYLPTSEASQMSRTMASMRLEVFAKRYFGSDFNVSFVTKPEYYFQRQRAYIDDSTPNSKIKTNKMLDAENYVGFELSLARSLNGLGRAGFRDEWAYGSELNDRAPRHVTQALLGVGAQWYVNRSLNFILQVENQTEVSRGGYTLLKDENNQIQLFTNISI